MANDNLNDKFFSYKGKPLVRNKNIIYYGSMLDDFVVHMQIISTKKVEDKELADKIAIQLMRTDTSLNATEIVVNKCDRNGMAAALEIADIWLSRALEKGI